MITEDVKERTNNLRDQAQSELGRRVKQAEDFIAENGLGSKYVEKVKKVQKNTNLTLLAAGALSVAGLATWAITRLASSSSEED